MDSDFLLIVLIFALTLVIIFMLYSYLFDRPVAIGRRLLPAARPRPHGLRVTLANLLQWLLQRLRASSFMRAPALKLRSDLAHAGFQFRWWDPVDVVACSRTSLQAFPKPLGQWLRVRLDQPHQPPAQHSQ